MVNIRLSNTERLELIGNLSTMISAGIPLLEGVTSLLNQSKKNQQILLQYFRDNLNQGKTISETFAEFPYVFDSITVNTIKIAEETGTLDIVFKSITENYSKQLEFNRNLRNSLLYPVLISLVFFVVVGFILIYVIPKIAQVFTSLNVNVPITAQILIFSSNVIINYGYLLAIALILFIIGAVAMYQYRRKLVMDFILNLPVISNLGIDIDFTNLCRNMYLLLSAGVPINKSFKLCEPVIKKKEVLDALILAEKEIAGGKDFSDALRLSPNVIPDFMVLIISTGERTGTLDKSMFTLAEYFEGKVNSKIKNIATLVEPAVIIIIGVFIGGMMFSIISPIYELIGSINGG